MVIETAFCLAKHSCNAQLLGFDGCGHHAVFHAAQKCVTVIGDTVGSVGHLDEL